MMNTSQDNPTANIQQRIGHGGSLASGLSLACLCLLCWVVLTIWLWQFPPTLTSDDALYFSFALTRFSVLDFSPHFPGYPIFVGLGRIVHVWIGDRDAALLATSTISALSLPPLAACILWRWTRSPSRAGVAFLLLLSQPILAELALSGLSDGTGLAFFLMFLAALPRDAGQPQGMRLPAACAAGVFLGLALWSRPSYGPIFLAAFLMTLRDRHTALAVLSGIFLVSLPTVLFLIAHEGIGYFREGLRFTYGHVFEWGNTSLANTGGHVSWLRIFRSYPELALLIAIYATCAVASWKTAGSHMPRHAALAGFIVALAWTATMQNPENLRHLAPVLVLGVLFASDLRMGRPLWALPALAAILLNLTLMVRSHDFAPQPSALARAVTEIDGYGPGTVVVTNRWAATFRDRLGNARVYERRFPGAVEAAAQDAAGPFLLISATALPGCEPIAVFAPRFLGEHGLYMYRWPHEGDPNQC